MARKIRSAPHASGQFFLSAAICVSLLACDTASEAPADGKVRETPPPGIISIGDFSARALLVMGEAESVVAADPVAQLIFAQAGLEIPDAAEGTGRARARHARVAVIDQEGSPSARSDSDLTDSLVEAFVPIVDVDPHNLDDAYALYREIAELIDEPSGAETLVRRLHAPLVERAARQLGRQRPCVAIVTSLAPLTLAGGHSFETDAIQLVGGESTTHGDEDWRTPLSLDDLSARAVDLIIVTDTTGQTDRSAPASEALRTFKRRVRPTQVQTTLFDASAFWLDDPSLRRSTLDRWEHWVEDARKAGLDRDNCSLDPAIRPASDTTR